ncbi:MAG: hypothetical protein BWY72_02030 [Bacteroidetes bacterium ADurb.Bin416]|nr:MAG: hypothetical protein BWY72_02030 [Bacteroidetes bacterium ADurb.Bin416]
MRSGVYWALSTGATRMDLPNMNWSFMSSTFLSLAKSMNKALIKLDCLLVTSQEVA